MNVGSMGRAIYNFASSVEGEISLRVGDVVQVHRKIDSHWYFGNQAGRHGNFPSSYIVEVSVPPFEDEQRVFVSSQPFCSTMAGDLNFDKDEIIIGLSEVDANWWNGACDWRSGIFPLTHVWEVDTTNLKRAAMTKVRKKARVKMDMKAQLDEEMDLQKGDIVTITEVLDKDWYRGECSGKTGMFPASFVVLLDDDESSSSFSDAFVSSSHATRTHQPLKNPSFDAQNVSSCQSVEIAPCARTLFAFTPQYCNELGFEAGETVTLTRHVDSEWLEGKIGNNTGIFPKLYVEVVVDCSQASEAENHFSEVNHSVITNNSQVEVISGQTQAQVLYDYFAQTEGDLTLVEDEVIVIFRQLNPDWYEAVDCQGNFGLCPANYLKLLPGKQKSQPRAESGSECSELSTSGSWEFVNNSPLNISNSNGSINKSNISSDGSFVMVPETSGCRSPQLKEPSYPPPPLPPSLAQNCTKRSYAQDDSFAYSFGSNVSSDALDKSILMNLDNLDKSKCSHKKMPGRSQSFNAPSQRHQHQESSAHSKSETEFAPDRRRSGSLHLSRPPARPPPPVVDVQAAAKHVAKPPRPTSIPFLKTLQEDTADFGAPVPPARNASCEVHLEHKDVMDKRPTRKAPSPPPAFVNQHTSQHQEKTVLIPHRPAPPVPYSSRLSSSSRGVREFSSQRRESTSTIVRFRNRPTHEQVANENDSSQLTKQLPELHHGSSRSKSLSMGTDSKSESSCITETRNRNHKDNNNMEQRQMVINELLQTEQTYIRDMRLCTSTFLQNPEEAKAKGIDTDVVFGNLTDVVDVAEKLYTNLSSATSASSTKILIGPCFQNLEEKMKQVYGLYCAKYADSIQLLEKYQENPDVERYFVQKMEIINQHITCLNLSALLIKPVQRIQKYPLLLNALIKCTDNDHEDKIELEKTMQLMSNLAGFVNEFKRRKDIVSKYLKDEDNSLSAMLSKLNLHSVVKKSNRIGMRLSSSIGLTSMTRDEIFDEEVNKFHALEKAVGSFERDVTIFCKQLEEWAKTQFELSEGVASFYMDECRRAEVERFRNIQRELYTFIFDDLKISIGKRVAGPLSVLSQTFIGPAKLIEKRYDKLLDYDSSTHRMEKNKDGAKSSQLREEHDLIKKNYEALNSQLVEELPKLFSVALAIFQDCVREFLVARKRFIGRFVKEMLPLAELPALEGVQEDILDNFQAQYAKAVSELLKLTFIPKNLFPSKPESKAKASSLEKAGDNKKQQNRSKSPRHTQTDESRRKLRSAYPTEKLYTSLSSYNAKDEYEISMNHGDLCAVLIEKDPMGVTSRWFVDNGEKKGFIPSNCLTSVNGSVLLAPDVVVSGPIPTLPKVTAKAHPTVAASHAKPDEPTERYDLPCDSSDRYDMPCDEVELPRYDFPTEELPSLEITSGANNLQDGPNNSAASNAEEYYYASFDFAASTASELSLQCGQAVLVLRKFDMDGNPEWWLIKDRFNNQGFAPANYLQKYNG